MRDSVPDGWREMRLGDVLRLEYGKPLPEKDRRPGRALVVGSAGIVGQHSEGMLPGPGIVIGRKGSIGKVTWLPGPFFPIDTTYFVDLINDEADLRWAFHALSHADLPRLNRATGIPGLNRDDVHALICPIPPLPEQRGIAAVLDAVDDTIERTDAVIAATEELRRALLHELLTHGVPGWHSEWKHVPGLGTVPACWEVTTLGEVTSDMLYGPRFPADRYATNGAVITLRTTDIDDHGRIDWSEAPAANVDIARFSQFLLRDGDIVVTRSGTCGIAAVFEGHSKPVLPGAFLIRMRPHGVESDWLKLLLNSPVGRDQTQRAQSGGVQKNLNGPSLRALHLPRPELHERRVILGLLETVADTHTLLSGEAEGLRASKNSLADALLAGRIRSPEVIRA